MEKKKYFQPQIKIVVLDNEISLALESAPPDGPEEVQNNIQSPFKEHTNLV